MSPPLIRYTLDPTGTNPDNYVNAEPHALEIGFNIRALAPTYGAFFTESIQVFDTTTNKLLTRGTQYICTELLDYPTEIYAKEICYLILIKDKSVSSTVRISYQALGGPYTRSADAIVNIYNNFQGDQRPVSWPDIINKPELFPPGPHLHDIGDVYGFEYLISPLERIRNAILLSDVPGYEKVLGYITDQIRLFKQYVQAQLDQLAQENQVIPLASHVNNGLMSSADKINLDNLLAISSAIPELSVILYGGALVSLPSQWKLCDGYNGTPNMVNVPPSGTSYGLSYIQYKPIGGTATTNGVSFVGGNSSPYNTFVRGAVVTITDTLVNTTNQNVSVTFSLVNNDAVPVSYSGSTKTVSVPANGTFVITDSFIVDIVSGASGAQLVISAPTIYAGRTGNSISYTVNTVAPTPAPTQPPANTPGILSWVTLDNQNAGAFTVGQTFTASVVLKCTGGVGNTNYNVGLNYVNCNGTDVGRLGSIAADSTATITTSATILNTAQASIIFTIANSSNGAQRNVIAIGTGVIVTPAPTSAPTPAPTAPPSSGDTRAISIILTGNNAYAIDRRDGTDIQGDAANIGTYTLSGSLNGVPFTEVSGGSAAAGGGWTLTSGQLPLGLSLVLAPGGLVRLIGSPTNPGPATRFDSTSRLLFISTSGAFNVPQLALVLFVTPALVITPNPTPNVILQSGVLIVDNNQLPSLIASFVGSPTFTGTPNDSGHIAVSGSLPPGVTMSLSSLGVRLQGTPTTPGTYVYNCNIPANNNPLNLGPVSAPTSIPYSVGFVVTGTAPAPGPAPAPAPLLAVSFLGAGSAPTKPLFDINGTYTISDTIINDTDQPQSGFVSAIGNGANTPKSNDTVTVPARSRLLVTASFTATSIPAGNVTGGEVYIYFSQSSTGGNSYNYHNTVQAAGILLSQYCTGTTLNGVYTDGAGGTIVQVIAVNSPTCGFV